MCTCLCVCWYVSVRKSQTMNFKLHSALTRSHGMAGIVYVRQCVVVCVLVCFSVRMTAVMLDPTIIAQVLQLLVFYVSFSFNTITIFA